MIWRMGGLWGGLRCWTPPSLTPPAKHSRLLHTIHCVHDSA